jgi:hypothetical protein
MSDEYEELRRYTMVSGVTGAIGGYRPHKKQVQCSFSYVASFATSLSVAVVYAARKAFMWAAPGVPVCISGCWAVIGRPSSSIGTWWPAK